jgi:Flp pilus assembly pilin Flp
MQRGQTTIEYVLVVLVIALVMVFALKNAVIENSIEAGSNYIANVMDQSGS